jgi:hypothetical protein
MRIAVSDAFADWDARVLLPCVAAGFAIFLLLQKSVLLAAGALVIAGVVALMLRWPETGTWVVLFSLYSNIAVLAMRPQTAIRATAGSAAQNPRIAVVLVGMSLLLAVPLLHHLLVRKRRLIFDRGFVLMLAFLAALLMSSLFARDEQVAASRIADYLAEGLVLYFLLTNVVRDFSALRWATWSLILAASLMGGLTVYQRATHTEDELYGGMAQMGADVSLSQDAQEHSLRPGSALARGSQIEGQLRAAGPIGEPNRYAQILLVVLPLGVLVFRTERSRILRTLGLIATVLILGGLLLTFSRGALLAGVALFAMMAYLRFLRPRQVLLSVLGTGVLVATFTPGVIGRMASLRDLKSLVFQTEYTQRAPDSSALHRYTLDVATWHVFLDHPVFGVGPGHFSEFYAIPYANRVGLIETTKKYLGHNLYLETLAETGLNGLVCLLAILLVIMRDLWNGRRRWLQTHPQNACWATAFFLCLCAYAISAVFAHLSYQRYFWVLVALSSAAARIVYSMNENEDGPSESVLASN